MLAFRPIAHDAIFAIQWAFFCPISYENIHKKKHSIWQTATAVKISFFVPFRWSQYVIRNAYHVSYGAFFHEMYL